MAKRILIVGNWETTHIRRFLSVLCREKDTELIIDSFDPTFDDNQGNECGVDNVFRINSPKLMRKFYNIRKLGTLFLEQKRLYSFDCLLRENKYDLVNIHFLPLITEKYVKIAHMHNVKVMLTPCGSDVLRVNKMFLSSLKNAFDKTDYVGISTKTGFYSKIIELFNVDSSKFVDLGYGSETLSAMLEMEGKYSRKQFSEMLSLPDSSYYICCGYTASIAQRHSIMIDAIAQNKDLLPSDYCLVIPLSYGIDKEYLKAELTKQCQGLELRTFFLTEYLTNEQVAALRFVSDLFIHIQPTDAYNASLQENLLAGTDVINGSWLKYPSLERYGNPYFICESLDKLPKIINQVISGTATKVELHKEIKDEIINNSWSLKIKKWVSFYNNVNE